MPFNQSGSGAAANIHGTYNDVAGNQTNTTDHSKHIGSVAGSTVVSGATAAGGLGFFGSGTGTATGVSNCGNINLS